MPLDIHFTEPMLYTAFKILLTLTHHTVFCQEDCLVLLLHYLATRELCCPQNCEACLFSGFFSGTSSYCVKLKYKTVYLLFLGLTAADVWLRLSRFSPVTAKLWTGLRAAAPPTLGAASEWSSLLGTNSCWTILHTLIYIFCFIRVTKKLHIL